MQTSIRPMGIREWIMLLVLSLLWGGSFFFVEVALEGLTPFTIVFCRVGLGALLLHLVSFLLKVRLPRDPALWGCFLVMGILNNAIPFSLIVSGQQYISGGMASILNASTPFFTLITTHLFTHDEKLNPMKVLGVIFGFLGVSVLIGWDSIGSGENQLLGQLLVLGAAVSYAFAGVWGRRFKARGIEPLSAATGQVSCSALVLLPLFLIIDRPWELPLPGLEVWGAILGIASLSTALAFILYFRILSTSGASSVVLVTFLVPVSALLLGFFFLGEQIETRQILGMALIGTGLLVMDGRLWRKIRSRRALAATKESGQA